MGFQSVRTGCRASRKQATETKRDMGLLLNIAYTSVLPTILPESARPLRTDGRQKTNGYR
jgi:hypothetical protein